MSVHNCRVGLVFTSLTVEMEGRFAVKILCIIVLITSNLAAELSMESKIGKRQTVSFKIQQFLYVGLV